MTLLIEIPGLEPLELDYLVLDVNGTLSDRGSLLGGVDERIASLRRDLEPMLLSADTFGTAASIAASLGVTATRAAGADEKLAALHQLGASRCVAIGNGANDASMLAEAALGIAVIGPEGASTAAVRAADVVCRSIIEALDLLREPKALAATLRR